MDHEQRSITSLLPEQAQRRNELDQARLAADTQTRKRIRDNLEEMGIDMLSALNMVHTTERNIGQTTEQTSEPTQQPSVADQGTPPVPPVNPAAQPLPPATAADLVDNSSTPHAEQTSGVPPSTDNNPPQNGVSNG